MTTTIIILIVVAIKAIVVGVWLFLRKRKKDQTPPTGNEWQGPNETDNRLKNIWEQWKKENGQ